MTAEQKRLDNVGYRTENEASVHAHCQIHEAPCSCVSRRKATVCVHRGSAVARGFLHSAHPRSHSRRHQAHNPAAWKNRVAVRRRGQPTRCKPERIRRLAVHRSRGLVDNLSTASMSREGERPASNPFWVRGPFGEDPANG